MSTEVQADELVSSWLGESQLSARQILELKVEVVALVLPHASVEATNAYACARRYLQQQADLSEVQAARLDCWNYLSSLHCYACPNDAAATKVVGACLDVADSSQDENSLARVVESLLSAGVEPEQIRSFFQAKIAEK